MPVAAIKLSLANEWDAVDQSVISVLLEVVNDALNAENFSCNILGRSPCISNRLRNTTSSSDDIQEDTFMHFCYNDINIDRGGVLLSIFSYSINRKARTCITGNRCVYIKTR